MSRHERLRQHVLAYCKPDSPASSSLQRWLVLSTIADAANPLEGWLLDALVHVGAALSARARTMRLTFPAVAAELGRDTLLGETSATSLLHQAVTLAELSSPRRVLA
jgi:hypothetical protein